MTGEGREPGTGCVGGADYHLLRKRHFPTCFFHPIAKKLHVYMDEEELYCSTIMEGIISNQGRKRIPNTFKEHLTTGLHQAVPTEKASVKGKPSSARRRGGTVRNKRKDPLTWQRLDEPLRDMVTLLPLLLMLLPLSNLRPRQEMGDICAGIYPSPLGSAGTGVHQFPSWQAEPDGGGRWMFLRLKQGSHFDIDGSI